LQKIDYDSDGDDTINWDGSSTATSKIGVCVHFLTLLLYLHVMNICLEL